MKKPWERISSVRIKQRNIMIHRKRATRTVQKEFNAEKEQKSDIEDCGLAEIDEGNENVTEEIETLASELEALEEEHADKLHSAAKLDKRILDVKAHPEAKSTSGK